MAISIYLSVVDEGGSPIDGSCDKTGREGMMECIEFNHKVYLPVDPVDGKITGNRRHEPIRLAKVTDKATPTLHKKLAQGATLQEAQLHFYWITPAGMEEEYYTITLEKAKLIDVSPRMLNTRSPAYEIYPHLEDLAFNYEKITWTFLDGNLEESDSYKAPA